MSVPLLSVVIASFNEGDELEHTIRSAILTSPPDALEIVVVDDCSTRAPVAIERWQCVKYARNSQRIGVGPSRYVGALRASGEMVLFCDAHMRFSPGWYEAFMEVHLRGGTTEEISMRHRTMYCGRCLGLPDDGDVNKPKSEYSGATWNFDGPNRNTGKGRQVFECVWASEKPGQTYEIAACMDACYFINREWFIELNALRHLRLWGGDEQELSLKAWLSGGRIVLLKNVRIGHKFRTGKIAGGLVMPWHALYSKMFVAETCLPEDYARRLRPKFQREQQYNTANRALRLDWHLVETMRAYNAKIFERSFQSYLDRFALSFPAA